MDKNNFISLLSRYSRSTLSEAMEVLAMKQRYPYSQLLHALSAKVSKDHGFSTQQQELQLAAVYAADRATLKEILETVHDDERAITPVITTPDEAPKNTSNKVEMPVPPDRPIDFSGIDLADAVIKDLEKLSQSRKDFELMFSQGAEGVIPKPSKSEVASNTPPAEKESSEDIDEVDRSKKSKKERIIAIAKAKALESSANTPDEKTGGKRRVQPTDALIQEIATTKKELDPENEKQKVQIEIIDQFIKAQPSINNSKDKPLPPPGNDLTTIKPGEFGDNIVSETLVDILLKQGKKDKAIEVLKKLIWKFPQKKAYFAAQIEELKK